MPGKLLKGLLSFVVAAACVLSATSVFADPCPRGKRWDNRVKECIADGSSGAVIQPAPADRKKEREAGRPQNDDRASTACAKAQSYCNQCINIFDRWSATCRNRSANMENCVHQARQAQSNCNRRAQAMARAAGGACGVAACP